MCEISNRVRAMLSGGVQVVCAAVGCLDPAAQDEQAGVLACCEWSGRIGTRATTVHIWLIAVARTVAVERARYRLNLR